MTSILTYTSIGLAALCLFLGTAWQIQTTRLNIAIREHRTFVAYVKAEGEAAQKAADKRKREDEERKKAADKKLASTIATLRRDNERLRNNARSNYVPAAPANSRKPEVACYGRRSLDEEVRSFAGGVAEIFTELRSAAVELNNAKEWANGR